MKFKKIPVRLFMPIGLLLVALPTFINTHFIALPDFLHGTLIGLGISLELTGFILMRRSGISLCRAVRPDTK